MVKFNSSRKSNKSKKTIRKLTAPEAVKHNKPKMVFDKCFMRGRYIISVFFVFLVLYAYFKAAEQVMPIYLQF